MIVEHTHHNVCHYVFLTDGNSMFDRVSFVLYVGVKFDSVLDSYGLSGERLPYWLLLHSMAVSMNISWYLESNMATMRSVFFHM